MPTKSSQPSTSEWSLILPSRSKTEALGEAIGRALQGGDVLALQGELGAGKTTLVRGIAGGLGLPQKEVSSPTFVLIHEYRGRLPLIHVDLYRLRHESEAAAIGLSEHFNDRSVAAVEWADRFPALLPEDRLEIALTHRSLAARAVTLSARGPQSRRLLARITGTPRPSRSAVSRRRTSAGRRTKKGAGS